MHISGAEMRIVSIEGGEIRNVIPREATAEIIFPDTQAYKVSRLLEKTTEEITQKYISTDPNLVIHLEETLPENKILPLNFQELLLQSFYQIPNGVYKMTPEMNSIVQTSNNISKVNVSKGKYYIHCLLRSSRKSDEIELSGILLKCLLPLNGSTTFYGAASGWNPEPDSPLVKLVTEKYQANFKADPIISAIHAGLECGIIAEKYPHIQMISFGPNILGAHSPDESVQISSVTKFWTLLIEVLEALAKQNIVNTNKF